MAETLGEKLARVQEAISAIESGRAKQYMIEGRQMTYIDLPILYAREESLIRKIGALGANYIEGSGGGTAKRRVGVVFTA